MKIDLKKFIELNNNYLKGRMGFNEISFKSTPEIENFLITNNFSTEYINKHQDMFCKSLSIEFNKNAPQNLNLDMIHRNNIPIDGDLSDLYFNTDTCISFYIVGSKKDIKNRVVKSFFDKDFSDFLFNMAFNSLNYKIIELPKKNIKYSWKKKELQNYSIINIFAQGEYSKAIFNKICFLPLFNDQSLNFKNKVLNQKYYIYELDGKHSEVDSEINELKSNSFLDYLDLEIDFCFLELIFDIYQENKLFTTLSFSDFIKYQEIVVKELKENTKLNKEEQDSFNEFISIIEKIEKHKNGLSNNMKINLKFKYPQYYKYII